MAESDSYIIRLYTSICGECQLLSPFLGYYSTLGVTEIHIIVNVFGSCGLERAVRDIVCSGWAIPVTVDAVLNCCKNDMAKDMNCLRMSIQKTCREYFIVADLDEFIVFGTSLANVVQHAERGGFRWLQGKLVDRVTEDGSIPKILSANIWSQFPLVGDFASKIHSGRMRKAVLQRGDSTITDGHHGDLREEPFDLIPALVHHFKWQGDLLKRLERRIHIQTLRKLSYVGEAQAVQAYLNEHAGKINVNDRRFGFVMASSLLQVGGIAEDQLTKCDYSSSGLTRLG